MRSRIGLAFLVVLIVAGAFLLRQEWATSRAGTASEVNAAEADALVEPDALLAPAPPRAEEAPTAAPSSSDPVSVPRRSVRARLVAFDTSTGQTVVPQAEFGWLFAAGCDRMRETTPRGSHPPIVEARLAENAVATEITVSIDEWGFRPAHHVFPLRAREAHDIEQVNVPLDPLEAAAWQTIRIVRPGEGETVSAAEAIRIQVARRASKGDPLRRLIEFKPGSPRMQEVRVPFALSEVDVKVHSCERRVVEDGRVVSLESPRWRIDPPAVESPEPPVFTVVRPPCALFEVDLRYPPGERPGVITMNGAWTRATTERRATNPLTMSPRDARMNSPTFFASFWGETDVMRIERDPGQLKSLLVYASGFTYSLDPPPPYELRLGETTRVVLEFRR